MYGSSPLNPYDTSKSVFSYIIQNLQSENESASKTVSRFPPIKIKTDDTPNYKENGKQVSPSIPIIKKISEETNQIQNVKKTNLQVRKKDKKKGKFIEIKPEVQEKYKQYN